MSETDNQVVLMPVRVAPGKGSQPTRESIPGILRFLARADRIRERQGL